MYIGSKYRELLLHYLSLYNPNLKKTVRQVYFHITNTYTHYENILYIRI